MPQPVRTNAGHSGGKVTEVRQRSTTSVTPLTSAPRQALLEVLSLGLTPEQHARAARLADVDLLAFGAYSLGPEAGLQLLPLARRRGARRG